MPFIKMALDAKEALIAPEGRYPLRIIKVEMAKSGDKAKIPGEPMIKIMISNEEPGANYAPVFHQLMLITDRTPDDNKQMYKLNIQRFLALFNIKGDGDGFDTDDFVGSETGPEGGLLKQDAEYDPDNPKNVLVPDRLDQEEAEEEAPTTSRRRRGRTSEADNVEA